MALEITNSLRGPSVVRCVEPGTYTISLASLAKNSVIETVTSADIKRATWSTNGAISVVRNSITLLSLQNSGEMRFDELGYSVSNNSTQSIVINIVTGGTIVMDISKAATYNVAPDTGFPV